MAQLLGLDGVRMERTMSEISTLKSLVGLIIHFFLTGYFEYIFVHKWLGYPLVPGTTTNNFWELVWLNLEIGFWVIVGFIPSVLLASLILCVLWLLYISVKAIPYAYAIIVEVRNDDSG